MGWCVAMGGGNRLDSRRYFFGIGLADAGKHWLWRRAGIGGAGNVFRNGRYHCGGWNGTYFFGTVIYAAAFIKAGGEENGTAVSALPLLRLSGKFVMVKGSFTVEAALLSPFICLVICGMLLVTLNLYETVGTYAEIIKKPQEKALSSADFIRLEAVIEDSF